MDEVLAQYFTDFDGKLRARLASVRPVSQISAEALATGTTARYECKIKVEYQKDLMRLLEEGMIVAVRNFKSTPGKQRFTLLEVSRVNPEHFGMKGLNDYSYYPVQFEIIQQSVADWESNDKSTMMIHIQAIPINYDLIFPLGEEPGYGKGFSYPVIAEEAYILNEVMIHQMYNRRILESQGKDWRSIKSSPDPGKDARLGVIKMFESGGMRIPLYVDFEKLVRYHFGVFSFTGGGKSNLLSNVLRRLIYHTHTKIIILDISMEYPFLLMDILSDPKIPSTIVVDAQVTNAKQMYETLVKPREFETDERVSNGFEEVIRMGRIEQYIRPLFQTPTFSEFFRELDAMRKDVMDKSPTYRNALDSIEESVRIYKAKSRFDYDSPIDEEFVDHIAAVARKATDAYKISEKSAVFGWANTLDTSLRERIRRASKEKSRKGVTTEKILELAEGPMRLLCLSIADPTTVKDLAIRLTERALLNRKRQFKVRPYVLFVFDEAQEFVPSMKDANGLDRTCSEQVEMLLRQGRKYGLGACIATQRIAYLNTNALQQLHTYFVGTLPRTYDRSVVSDTFMIDKTILEKTLEFAPGEWLLSSYLATGMENVPIFLKADDAEDSIGDFLKGVS